MDEEFLATIQKGNRIAVPKDIREIMNLRPGTRVRVKLSTLRERIN